MIIREFEKQDIPRVIELSRQLASHVADPDPKLDKDTLLALGLGSDRWFEILVVEDEGIVVGFAAFVQRFELHTNSRMLFISDLAVSNTNRRQGVGKTLLDALRAVAVERNCHAINLEVWKENEVAQSFYLGNDAEVVNDVELFRLTLNQR